MKWDKYHKPYKDNIKEKKSGNEIVVRIKEHSFANNIVSKSSRKANESKDQIIVEPMVGMVKDLVAEILMVLIYISVRLLLT